MVRIAVPALGIRIMFGRMSMRITAVAGRYGEAKSITPIHRSAYSRLNSCPWGNPEYETGGWQVLVREIRRFLLDHIMKTYKHLWEEFISKENFEVAYRKSMKGKSKQRQVRKFNLNAEENLEVVRQSVVNGMFKTSRYRQRKIFEPKERIIYKLPYSPDRIVQHAIMNILEPILTNLMIENTYSCIKGRGQIKASQKCSEYVRKNKYCLKCDISKFYPSINQKILSDKFHRIIKDSKFMAVLDDVIFSFEGGYNCPIGNYLSQWCGNFYLSFMDNYILHQLKPNGYLRYCDDFILFSNDKRFLHDCKKQIGLFLQEYELKFSKAEVFDTKQGVDFCGYRHFKKYVLIRKSTSKRIKRRITNIRKGIEKNWNLNLAKIEGQVASAHGVLKHACSYNYRISLGLDALKSNIVLLKGASA